MSYQETTWEAHVRRELVGHRKAAGVQVATVAERAGVNRRTVTRWESGASPMTPPRHQLYARLCGVDLPAVYQRATDRMGASNV